jgi:hypothetical protein
LLGHLGFQLVQLSAKFLWVLNLGVLPDGKARRYKRNQTSKHQVPCKVAHGRSPISSQVPLRTHTQTLDQITWARGVPTMAPDSFHDSSVEAMFLRNDAGLALSDLFFAKAFFNEDGHNDSPDHTPNLLARSAEQSMLFPIGKA